MPNRCYRITKLDYLSPIVNYEKESTLQVINFVELIDQGQKWKTIKKKQIEKYSQETITSIIEELKPQKQKN